MRLKKFFIRLNSDGRPLNTKLLKMSGSVISFPLESWSAICLASCGQVSLAGWNRVGIFPHTRQTPLRFFSNDLAHGTQRPSEAVRQYTSSPSRSPTRVSSFHPSSITTLCGSGSFQHLPDQSLELWQFILDHIPDNIPVHAKIMMDDLVP